MFKIAEARYFEDSLSPSANFAPDKRSPPTLGESTRDELGRENDSSTFAAYSAPLPAALDSRLAVHNYQARPRQHCPRFLLAHVHPAKQVGDPPTTDPMDQSQSGTQYLPTAHHRGEDVTCELSQV